MARARSFGNIRKLPSGRYQARYWRLGKQVAADTTFASKTDARRWLATVEADLIRGVWVDPDAGRIPFGRYAMRWVAERPVRPLTREIYEGPAPTHRSGVRQRASLRRPPRRRADVARPARSERPAPQHGGEDLSAVPFDHDHHPLGRGTLDLPSTPVSCWSLRTGCCLDSSSHPEPGRRTVGVHTPSGVIAPLCCGVRLRPLRTSRWRGRDRRGGVRRGGRRIAVRQVW